MATQNPSNPTAAGTTGASNPTAAGTTGASSASAAAPAAGTPAPQVTVTPLEAVSLPAPKESVPAGAEVAVPSGPVAPRSMAQIQSDMDATRDRLTDTINQLSEMVKPQNIARRQVEKVKAFYTDEYGAVRPDRVAMTVGVVVGSVVVVKTLKRIF